MGQELVWARVGDHCAAVSRSQAEGDKYEVLDESPLDANGDVRRPTRADGRPIKPKTTVATKATVKDAAASKAAEVIADPASTEDTEETPR